MMSTQQQKQFNVLLIGDDGLDVYQYGNIDRISPEAPVPVFSYVYSERRLGMASNVYINLTQLGCAVNFLHSERSVKTRLVDIRSKQQIVRIDEDVVSTPVEFATAIPKEYDAIVISDYDKGTVTYELIQEIREQFSGPIFIDTKKRHLHKFEGCFVKINRHEYDRAESKCSDLIVTCGQDGVAYKAECYPAIKVEVSDVTGAGDTFLSALVFEYLKTSNMSESIKFAIKASTVTVQHYGVYAPTLEEINAIVWNG